MPAKKTGREANAIGDTDLASYVMYPKVYTDFARMQDLYGPTPALLRRRPTSTACSPATR